MIAETLHYENARFAQQLFHNDPRNLKAIETQLGVLVTARDTWLRLGDVPRAYAAFDQSRELARECGRERLGRREEGRR